MRIQMDGDVVFLPINSLRCAASEVGSGRRRSLNLKPEAEPTSETVSFFASRRQSESSNSNFGDGTIGVGVGIGIGIDKTNGNSTPIPIPTPTPMTQSPHIENCWLGAAIQMMTAAIGIQIGIGTEIDE
ncbi:MAG: hypothetical protein WCG22_02750, partial [Lentisphaerota bacterium]